MTTDKFTKIPKYVTEIIITVISYLALCILWYFFIGEFIILSNQGLSTFGIALSTSIGVLTAIVVSFTLIVWQTSRRDRSESFLRWRNTLHQLFDYYDSNIDQYPEIREDVTMLTQEASAVASIEPMKRQRYKELVSPLSGKLTEYAESLLKMKSSSSEQANKALIGKNILDYLVMLEHTNFDHNVAHSLYKGLLELRGLLYRLLCVLGISIIIVIITVITTTPGILNIFNAPIALVLIVWVIYLLVHLGIIIKRFTRLEDEFLRIEKEAEAK